MTVAGRAAVGSRAALAQGACRRLPYRPSVTPASPNSQGVVKFGGMVSGEPWKAAPGGDTRAACLLPLIKPANRPKHQMHSVVKWHNACTAWSFPWNLQELTRGNLLGLAMGAACTVWLYDLLYEEREAQQVGATLPPESVALHRARRGRWSRRGSNTPLLLSCQVAKELKRRRQAEGEPRRIPDV